MIIWTKKRDGTSANKVINIATACVIVLTVILVVSWIFFNNH